MTTAAVVAASLSKRFGARAALEDLSLSVQPGEVVGLLGANGAGKTTALKLLLGMLRPTSGHAQVLDFDCTRRPDDVKARVGYTPDEPAFYDFLTGRESLAFVIEARRLEPRAAWRALAPLIERLGFGEMLDILTHGYSHGMKKKLALLCALVHAPRVLLLDEPTNGRDPQIADEVRRLITERARDGVAVLISTHLLDLADRACDRLAVRHRGRLVASGDRLAVRRAAGVADTAPLKHAFLTLSRS